MNYTGQSSYIELSFYCEGPAMDSRGSLYCTNLSGGQILKISPGGLVEEWARSACPNGQIILENDDHLVCDSKLGTIRRFDANGVIREDKMNGYCAGKKISVPNDLVSDQYGGIYFTDSLRYEGCVGYIGADGNEMILAKDLDYPNGLGLSPDGAALYVAESYKNRVLKISLREENPELSVFATLPAHPSGRPIDNLPDGLRVDVQGNLWIAHYGMSSLQILSSEGELLRTQETGIRLTSNLFLGDDCLLITGGSGEPGPGLLKIIRKQ